MNIARVRQHLLPSRDPRVREHLSRLSASGLETLGWVEIAAALLLYVSRLAAGMPRWPESLSTLGVGLVTLGLWHSGKGRYAQALAAGSVWLAAALLMIASGAVGADDFLLLAVTVLILTAVATIPFL